MPLYGLTLWPSRQLIIFYRALIPAVVLCTLGGGGALTRQLAVTTVGEVK